VLKVLKNAWVFTLNALKYHFILNPME